MKSNYIMLIVILAVSHTKFKKEKAYTESNKIRTGVKFE